jgi:hypothetical protein
MGCSFAYVENSCGCLTGYTLPLKQADNTDITAYPVDVLNVNGVDLGEANTPSEYVILWNSDAANKAVGVLSVGTGAFCFALSRIDNVVPPSKVLGSVVAPPPQVNFNFDYGFTAADTTGAALTEAQYLASVDDVYTAGTEVHGAPLAPGSNVQVVSFGNGTDKVLFMQIDATEAAFTMWSVVGDALQQNQPIDQTFGGGANVWFKSAHAGKTIYITRSQTSFAGPVLFSR